MIRITKSGEVVQGDHRRLRSWLVALLVAFVAAACVVVILAAKPGSVCLAYGPGPVNNGKAVIAAGVALDVPEDAIVAGLSAAMRETGLHNMANPNVPESLTVAHDGLSVNANSVGILAQTPWWGPADVLMRPASAAAKFFVAMREEAAGAVAMTPAQLAARVQRSAFVDAYAAQVPAARQFYRDHVGEVRSTRCGASEAAATEASW